VFENVLAKNIGKLGNPRNKLEIIWKHLEYWGTQRFAKSVGQKQMGTLEILGQFGNHLETLGILGNTAFC
jgi:hypothetical protein